MNTIEVEELKLLFTSNNINSKNEDQNSYKNIGNEDYFLFTIDDNQFKDFTNKETYNPFTYFKELNNMSLDNFTNIFDTNTEETTDNIFEISNNNSNITQPYNPKKILFQAKKRGRQKFSESKKEHDKHCLDNLLTKIQVHFLSFIINLSNDALKAEFGEKTPYNFKHLSHKIKKNVNFNSFYNIKNSMIKDVLEKEISTKYKNSDKNINIEILKKVCGQSDWLKDFFNIKYIILFKDYYYIEEPLTKIEYKDKTITLSNKTKSFYYLLKKNKTQTEEINRIIKQIYLNIKTGYCGQEPFTSKKKID